MTDAEWKLVVDQQGVTIASDRFQFTTSGTRQSDTGLNFDEPVTMNTEESSYMEAVVAELHAMTRRTYGQYCGLVRGLEVIGERWTMLFLRDLLVRSKSLDELHEGFPAVAKDIVSARVRELEHCGVVKQVEEEDGVTRYRLTAFGRELEDVLIPFGRWGARLLGDRRPEDVTTIDSVVMAFRTMFRPENADGVTASFQFNVDGHVVWAKVADSKVEVGSGPLSEADLVLDEPGDALMPMLTGELTAAEAVDTGAVKIIGDPVHLATFTRLFQITPKPTDD